MRGYRAVAGLVTVAAVLGLAACTPTPVPEPIAVKAEDVQGETVTVAADQLLYIDTSGLDARVDSYRAEIEDESIVEFMPGRDAGDFAYYPGFAPLKVGSVRVTLANDDAGIQPLEFTIEVTPGR